MNRNLNEVLKIQKKDNHHLERMISVKDHGYNECLDAIDSFEFSQEALAEVIKPVLDNMEKEYVKYFHELLKVKSVPLHMIKKNERFQVKKGIVSLTDFTKVRIATSILNSMETILRKRE